MAYVTEFITSIPNKVYNQIRNSKSDAECRRYLSEHLKTHTKECWQPQTLFHSDMCTKCGKHKNEH